MLELAYNREKEKGRKESERMKLGGYSHTDGITFYCDVIKIKGKQRGHKRYYKLDWILPKRWLRDLEKKPLLGGITQIYYQWKVFDKRVKILLLLLISLLFIDEYFYIPLFSDIIRFPFHNGWLLITAALLLLIYRKKIVMLLRYHGAEHKVINCYCQYGMIDYQRVKDSERYNRHCGSNLVVVFLALYGFFYLIDIESVILTILLFLIAIQIIKKISKFKGKGWDNAFKWVQLITVWEPKDEQIILAMEAFTNLRQAYALYQREQLIIQNHLEKNKN